MAQSTADGAAKATAEQPAEAIVDELLDWLRPQLIELVESIKAGLRPTTFLTFELSLLNLVREFGRLLLQRCLNGLEDDPAELRDQLIFRGQGYRRLKQKTRNAHVATLFGTVTLHRFPYRSWHRFVSEPCVFPLELQLGLVEGVTPALASRIGKCVADLPQQRVLQWLREEHRVSMGVKRLRKLTAVLSEEMSEHRQQTQAEALLQALQDANQSRGNRKPVLAVGRDGITLCEHGHSFWEVATAATVTVFDRAGKRLATVYLAHSPELGQATMSRMLTDLLLEVLEAWEGPLPTLAYITDSGDNESSYYEDQLRTMCHPRTGQRLDWQRVVDFYHVAERVWAIAEALFGKKDKRYASWARRMLKTLKRSPSGARRLLHSAAAHASRRKLSESRRKQLEKACNYIRRRTQWMKYNEYRKRHIPIGSGITEAACKTVFTQRLKLSGMRWSREGADRILILRTILLSRVWDATFSRSLEARESLLPTPYAPNNDIPSKMTA